MAKALITKDESESDGRTPTGQFKKGNKLQKGYNPKRELTVKYRRCVDKVFTDGGLKALQREQLENPSKSLDRVQEIWKHETPKKVEIDTQISLRAEIVDFTSAYRAELNRKLIGADVIEAEVIEAEDGQE
jgi:hypothetical protein